ncbi:MAG TPA: MBL fold metallo-hydrolase [Phycisphaerae bacterium]|nr:MBL fold metallo-hydrolase [Phycisphaerae bacterium]HRY68637.1 MBL fold metallo-hydrolase [Phycisphaerae bacterium]HSA25463.1 MBL fold metallo-hydrolase [Phycisphaerae bacterium]
MLTLTFLGVGSAFAKRNYNSNLLIEAWHHGPGTQSGPDDTLLVDFGSTGPLALYQLMQKPGFTYLEHNGIINYPAIHKVFVTHQHADHIGGLEEMALMNAYVYRDPARDKAFKPQIISSLSILMNLWDHSLKGGLSVMAGRYALLQDYFFILALNHQEAGKDGFSMLKRYRFTLFPTDHIQVQHKFDWPSFGLFIEDVQTGESAFYSGDTRYDYPAYARMMERARICFHEVQLVGEPAPVHTLLSELRTLPEAVRRKTHLYHFTDDWDTGPFDSVREEFAGFAVPQQRYTILD